MLERIYLDANGSCPPTPLAKKVLASCLDMIGNPSSFHEHGRALRAMIDEAREHVSQALGVRGKEVIFTSGASEANRLFVDSLLLFSRHLGRKVRVVMSPMEHPSMLKPMVHAHDKGELDLLIMSTDENGHLIIPQQLSSCDVLIACKAHNETGILLDISSLITHLPENAIFMSDISQSFSRLDKPHERIDIMSFSAQKMGGFAGCGGLALRNRAKELKAPWLGGSQEKGFRPGTEAWPLIKAFGGAAFEIDAIRAKNQELLPLRVLLEEELLAHCSVKVIGYNCERLPNTSAICFYEEDADALRIACDMAGLSVGFGSACSGLAPEGSYFLNQMGLTQNEQRSTVRFSLAPDTSKDQIEEVIKRLLNKVINHKPHA